MTQVTPPGWYPDPGQTSDGPPTERWWDGKAWTEQTRPAGPAAAWGPPGQPAAAGEPPADITPEATPEPADSAPSPASPASTAESPAASAEPDPRAPDQAAPAAPAAPQDPAQHPTQTAFPAYPGQPGAPVHPGRPGGPVYPSAADPSGHPGYPGQPEYLAGYPGYPGQPPAGGRRRLRTGVAVGVAAAVLASIGVGVYALTNDSGTGSDTAGSTQSPSPQGSGGPGGPFGGPGGGGGEGGESPAPQQSTPPPVEGGGTVPDPVNAISMPVPEGWTGQGMTVGAQVTSEDTYDCPGDTSKSCTKGGAYSAPAIALGTEGSTPEAVAKADIEANAEESYGGTTYGKITSHEELSSEAVTVAGQKGWKVRWKAVTSKGADGIVESLVFPSPANPEQLVVVRFGVDADQPQSVIDEITKGIKASSGGGSGQDI
ncbi:DUF2510 domain-containing protein [Streptomyces sp. NPDC088387]|uniref:DUF2510 domain-containing protein n=1 Tax=Streptomyces sp. NPDC088387 TaxID=3365859 RepID=UPI0037FA2B7F